MCVRGIKFVPLEVAAWFQHAEEGTDNRLGGLVLDDEDHETRVEVIVFSYHLIPYLA